ncbi:MAG: hypothetical protein R3C19_04310 [Planctomycetaceae bacterium]
MASPFKFFRKHQAGMMVVLVILSMLLFTLDSLFSTREPTYWLLGLLIGGAAFGIAGISQGRWLQWGLGGGLLGAALGFMLPTYLRPPGVISTSLGIIEQEELDDLEMRRFIANRFLVEATGASGQFPQQFGFGHQSISKDVLFGKLLQAKAESIGISATQSMVNDFIHQATAEKLTAPDFARIRSSMRYQGRTLDDETLFEILGDQLQAVLAYQMLRPAVASLPPAPEVFWQYFRRLNVRQQLNTAAFDVDAFLDQVAEPTDSEVELLFAENRQRFPNELEGGSAGFRLQDRMQLAYLELDYETMESQVPEISDTEIEEYYEANKDVEFSIPVIPDANSSDDAEPAASDTPSTDEATPKPGDAGSDDAAVDKDSPTEGEADVKLPDAKTEVPETESTPPTEPESASDTSDEQSADQPDGADECNPFAQDDDSGDNATGESSESTASDEAASDGATAAEEGAAPAVAEDTPSATPADGSAPEAAATQEPGTPPLSLEIPETTPDAATKSGDDKMEVTYEYRELNEDLKSQIRDRLLRQRAREVINAKTREALAVMQTLSKKRDRFAFGLIEENPEYHVTRGETNEASEELRARVAEYARELNAELKAWAAENGFAYVETPMLSYADLLDGENYPIGLAKDPEEDAFGRSQGANVAYTVFSAFVNQSAREIDPANVDTQLYIPRLAATQSFGMNNSGSYFAYWPISFSLSHVPTLDEPGVRDQVVLTWKRQKARELAEKQATALAEEVRTELAKEGEAKPTMASVLEGRTVTDQSDGADLAVRTTQPFSWLKAPLTPQMNFQQQQQVTQSTIQFSGDGTDVLGSVGDEFMRTIFEEMNDGDIRVVPNFDRSAYYIVQVTNRFPTPEIGEDDLRERFLNEGQQFAFAGSPIIDVMQREILLPANVEWEKAIWREFGVNPDSEE